MVLDEAYSYLCYDLPPENRETRNRRLPFHLSQKIFFCSPNEYWKDPLCYTCQQKLKRVRNNLQYQHAITAKLQAEVESLFMLSKTTRCSWRMSSGSEQKLRIFRREFKGWLQHWSLKLKPSEPKSKDSSARQRRLLLSALYLPNKAPIFLNS